MTLASTLERRGTSVTPGSSGSGLDGTRAAADLNLVVLTLGYGTTYEGVHVLNCPPNHT